MYPKRRVKVQGYDDFEILEQHLDENIAANREIELQKQYGYKVDVCKYNQTDYSAMGKIAGELAVKTKHIHKIQKQGSKIAAALPRSKEQIETFEKARLIGNKIAWSLPRSKKQKSTMLNAQKIGCVLGGKVMGAIMKEKLRVPIAAYTKCDKLHIGNYYSVSACARELNLRVGDIFNCLNPNKSQYSTKGYTFIKIKK